MKNGKFVISLDFELMWGVRDKRKIENYGDSIRAVHHVIPRLLVLFNKYGIHATFSIVGLLFFEQKEDLLNMLPNLKPKYKDKNLSPYTEYIDTIGDGYSVDPYHYAPQLIKEIQKFTQHEIGTHTFSHYYCLEEGQNIDEFTQDISAAIKIADQFGLQLKSLIFPRNQFNELYLKEILKMGIISYRGNENSWLYSAKPGEKESKIRRALRLIDAYVNISGHNTYTDAYMRSSVPVNIPSSRLLRAYSRKLKPLDYLKLRRIKIAMSYACKTNTTFHLWWHPHNFGRDIEENFKFLEEILKHYQMLHQKYGFKSQTMTEIAEKLR